MTRDITVIPGRHHLTSQFFLISNKKTQTFKNRPGTNSNDLSSMNPSNANFQPSSATNFLHQENLLICITISKCLVRHTL